MNLVFNIKKEQIINYSIAFAFAGMLIHKKTLDITFVILISIFFILIFKENLFENMDRDDYLFLFFLVIFPISVILNMIFLGFNMAYLEKAWRFFLGIPIFLLIRKLGLNIYHTKIGIFVGLVIVFLLLSYKFAFIYHFLYSKDVRYSTFLPPLQFGAYIVIISFIFFIINDLNVYCRIFVLLILIISLIFNNTRAAWLLLPFMVYIYTFKYRIKFFIRATVVFVAIVLLLLASFYIKPIYQRINDGIIEIKNYIQKIDKIHELDLMSLDARLEMYRYSLTKFKESPLFGSGYRDFYKDIDKLVEEKKFNKYLLIKPRIHSDLIGVLGYQGITGLICYLTFIFGLFYLFVKKIKSGNSLIKHSSLVCLITLIGYFIFYQTDTMFGTVISNNYFTFIISVFYGYIRFLETNMDKNFEVA